MYNYSEMEQMVREATCNDAARPSEMLMKEISKGTLTVEFSAIMTSASAARQTTRSPAAAATASAAPGRTAAAPSRHRVRAAARLP